MRDIATNKWIKPHRTPQPESISSFHPSSIIFMPLVSKVLTMLGLQPSSRCKKSTNTYVWQNKYLGFSTSHPMEVECFIWRVYWTNRVKNKLLQPEEFCRDYSLLHSTRFYFENVSKKECSELACSFINHHDSSGSKWSLEISSNDPLQ